MPSSFPIVKRPRYDDDEDDNDQEFKGKRLIVVLENCSLESAKVGRDYVILSSDRHAEFLKSHKRNPNDYRPDILHQCLLTLLDSPLNRASLLQIYVHTSNNVLIEVHPQTRLPRTFDRFSGLMVQLLHKLFIKAENSPIKLLKVIKNPVSSHLPVGCRKILTTFQAEELVKCRDIPIKDEDRPIIIVVGGMAKGKVSVDYTEEELKISNFPLSAALTCAKLTTGFEEAWGVE
uniref:18S rRNA (pseudouridine-N1)-methyltransferase n=1 Tax=Syphacia muris TaxID=451379 RepID=A0A0N5AFK4_9BILA